MYMDLPALSWTSSTLRSKSDPHTTLLYSTSLNDVCGPDGDPMQFRYNGNRCEIRETCLLCKETQTFNVGALEMQSFLKGSFVQDAFPDLSDADRELLISQTCGTCWDKLFPEGEEDDDADDPGVDAAEDAAMDCPEPPPLDDPIALAFDGEAIFEAKRQLGIRTPDEFIPYGDTPF